MSSCQECRHDISQAAQLCILWTTDCKRVRHLLCASVVTRHGVRAAGKKLISWDSDGHRPPLPPRWRISILATSTYVTTDNITTDRLLVAGFSVAKVSCQLQLPVVVTTSHQCYGSCTGCQFVSESRSRSPGSCISRSLVLLPRILLITVIFCLTLVVVR